MSALYLDLLKRYHGPKVLIEPVYSAEWVYIQHFYFGFYVWQYATSITAANFFAQKVMTGTAADRDRYLAVLRAGGSDYGYNLLKIGGLDMATAEPYQLIIASFDKVMDQAEALLLTGPPPTPPASREGSASAQGAGLSASRTGSCGGPWRGRTSCARRRAGRGSGSRRA